MILRPARDDEYDAVATLWYESWMSIGIANETDLPLEDLKKRVRDEIAGGWQLFIIADETALAGMLALRPPDHLDQLFIAPDYQGQGIGRALLNFARTELGGDIRLWTAADNRRACDWYEREGFVETGRDYVEKNRRQRVHYMWRRI